MNNTLFDQLNQILTNTLEYKELLDALTAAMSDVSTADKLRELAQVKEKQSEHLIKHISKLGGDIESTGGLTDQAALSWITTPVPEVNDRVAILTLLISAEQNALQAYQELMEGKEVNTELQKELEIHLQEANANLQYFETAKQTLIKR